MAEKEIIESDDEKLISQMSHRVSLLIATDKELDKSYEEQEQNLNEQQTQFKEELLAMKAEINALKETSQQLRKAVFVLGHQLKDKVTDRMIEIVQEKVDAWPLEEYITKKELPELFEKYAKK